MKRGHAVVFDGLEKILDMSGEIPKKRPITKEQFFAEWALLDADGRRRLMATTTPIISDSKKSS